MKILLRRELFLITVLISPKTRPSKEKIVMDVVSSNILKT